MRYSACVCVLMAANRQPDALIAAAVASFMIWRHRYSALLWLFAGAAIPLALLLYFNLEFIGHIAGGYALGVAPGGKKFFHFGWTGIFGLLVSPTRGLLIFTPFLLLLPVGLKLRLRELETRGLAIALIAAVVAPALALLAGGLARRNLLGTLAG